MRMMRVLAIGVFIACAACGEGAAGPKSIDAAVLAGSWELTREPITNCAGAGTALQTKYYFTVPAGSAGGSVKNVVSSWEVAQPPRFNWTLTGNFDLSARTVELRFWLRTLDVGSMFTASNVAPDGSATGTLVDPVPGYRPHFVLGACAFPASIRRVGS